MTTEPNIKLVPEHWYASTGDKPNVVAGPFEKLSRANAWLDEHSDSYDAAFVWQNAADPDGDTAPTPL